MRIVSNGKIMTAYEFHKPLLSWKRDTKEILHPVTLEPIVVGNMLDFTEILQKGRNK